MSGRLVSSVFESRLTARLKLLAALLATFGRDDGTSIRPSVKRIARDIGRSERRVQDGLTDLQRLGVLIVVRRHAPGRPTEYRLDLQRMAELADALPTVRRVQHQLNLPIRPQVFNRGVFASPGDGASFPHFHRRTQDDPNVKPDGSVTRSVIRSVSTNTYPRVRVREGDCRKGGRS